MITDPSPDGIHRVFGVPETNLVADSLMVYLNGELLDTAAVAADPVAGTFTIDAPDEGAKLVASYYFQWFTDDDLTEFLQQAVQLLRFDSIIDVAIPIGLRTPVLSFAAYFAYIKMAGQSAPALLASATGFSSDSSHEHPYWMDLAKAAWDEALKAMEVFNQNPVGSLRPNMKFVNFRMAPWVPRS